MEDEIASTTSGKTRKFDINDHMDILHGLGFYGRNFVKSEKTFQANFKLT